MHNIVSVYIFILIYNGRAVAVYSPEREKGGYCRHRRESIHCEIHDRFSEERLRSYIISNGTKINEKKIAGMKGLAGRFMIVSDTDLSITDMVKGYKDLWRIERSFSTMKSFLEIRPVYHSKEERIEARVFLCVLSLLISRLFEKAMDEG